MTQLYAITPPHFELDAFAHQLEEAFKGGELACVQLRLKDASDATVRKAAKRLMPICHAHETPFILNDSLEIALELQADGVHLGQEDIAGTSVKAIRKQMPDEMVLGITCHASSHLAMEAGEQGADYVAFGAFYPTTSKPKEKLEKWGTPTTELLEMWTKGSTLPCVAIGGITPDNCAPLIQSGADFIAAITGIWNHPQGAGAGVKTYHEAITKASSQTV